MSVAKETVRCISYLDGVKTGQRTGKRNVYTKKDGTMHISDGKIANRAADGVAEVEYRAKTMNSQTLGQVLADIRAKHPGAEINIISLSDSKKGAKA